MAFTNAPIIDTYSSHRLPLVQPPFNIETWPFNWKLMQNVLPYKKEDGTEMFSMSRYGVTGYVVGSNAPSTMRGLYVWEKSLGTIYYFAVVNTSVYTATSINGPWTAVDTLLTSATTPVRFVEFIDATNVKKLVMVDGVEGYVYTSNASGTKIVDVDFPTPHVAFPIFLNGRLHLAKANTGDIYCSDLNDPAAWTAGNFISSEVYPDDVQALVKINNYILCIGINGSEFFYDAANALGSPLARQEGSLVPFGTIMPNTIASNNNTCVFLGKSPDGDFCLRAVEDFKFSDISAPFLVQEVSTAVITATTAAAMRGYFFRQQGRLFYALARDGTRNDPDGVNYFHYVYSFDTKIWTSFTRGQSDGSIDNSYADHDGNTYPVFFSATGNSSNTTTIVAGHTYNNAFVGTLAPFNQGCDSLPYNGGGGILMWYKNSIPLDQQDFGSMNQKTMHRVGLTYSNSVDGTLISIPNSPTSYLPVLTWKDSPLSEVGSGAHSQIFPSNYGLASDLATANIPGFQFPFLTQLGSFRRRWLTVACYGACVFNHLDVDINKGQR